MSTLHRNAPQILVVGGILSILVCYFADQLGLGITPGLGDRHLIGILFGLITIVNGIVVWAVRDQ